MAAGTDGDPHTVQEDGGGDFLTLNAALSDVAIDTNHFIEIQGSWTNDDTAACTVADTGLTIRTAGTSKHAGLVVNDGASSEGHYRLVKTSGGHCITVNQTGCTINDLVVKQGQTGASDECIRMAASGGATLNINSCIIWGSVGGSSNDQNGIFASGITCTINVTNCQVYGFSRSGICSQGGANATITYNINSCSIWDNGYDDNDYDTGGCATKQSNSNATTLWNIYNTICVGNHTSSANTGNATNAADFNDNAASGSTVTWNIDYSIGSDLSLSAQDSGAVGSLEQHNHTDDNTKSSDGDWVIFEDITSTPFDLRLQSHTYNEAENMHSTGTGAGLSIPSTDIVGTSRATAYECGSFTIAVAGGGANPKGPLGHPFLGPFGGPIA